ncbi:heparin lyase I family protein [Nocardia sp. NPDC046473]|uniref:heparin lyase I family protein n=1 Tax=Nocardia sp. NPDC046473 TaxID=3155733 RepID=UPI0033DF553E
MSSSERYLDWVGTTTPRSADKSDYDKDPLEIFHQVQVDVDTEASIKVVDDPQETRGRVWLFDKPSHDTSVRCQSSGIVPLYEPGARYEAWDEGEIYDISWSSLLMPMTDEESQKFGSYIVFDWRSYQGGVQDSPFHLKVSKKAGSGLGLDLVHSNESRQSVTIWEGAIESGQWQDIRLRVRFSGNRTQGWIRLYLNGEAQDFSRDDNNGPTQAQEFRGRTWDYSGSPKWGVYNRNNPGQNLKHYLDSPRIRRIK